MDARTLATGKTILYNFYQRQCGPIAFIDETYRGKERLGEPPFYLFVAVLIEPENLDFVRAALKSAALDTYWHTTESARAGNFREIQRMVDGLKPWTLAIVCSLQIDITEQGLELARRESLIQLAKELLERKANLLVIEQGNRRKQQNADASLASFAVRDGLLSGVRVVQSSPAIEPILWAADLACWSLRQFIVHFDPRWLRRLGVKICLIDTSRDWSRNEKRPASASAVTSPESSGTPLEEKTKRSSFKILSESSEIITNVLNSNFVVLMPKLQPKDLRAWLGEKFPD